MSIDFVISLVVDWDHKLISGSWVVDPKVAVTVPLVVSSGFTDNKVITIGSSTVSCSLFGSSWGSFAIGSWFDSSWGSFAASSWFGSS